MFTMQRYTFFRKQKNFNKKKWFLLITSKNHLNEKFNFLEKMDCIFLFNLLHLHLLRQDDTYATHYHMLNTPHMLPLTSC